MFDKRKRLISEGVIRFNNEKNTVYSLRTLNTYCHHLREFIFSLEGEGNNNVEQKDIDNFIQYLKRKKFSDATISNYLYALKVFVLFHQTDSNHLLNFYLNDYTKTSELKSRLISKNEFHSMVDEIVKKAMISENELHELISLRDLLIIQLLIETGIKTGELCEIKVGDIDLKAATLRIKEKERPERRFVLKDSTLNLIRSFIKQREYIHQIDVDKPLFASFDKKNGLVGLPITPRTLQRIVSSCSNGQFTPKDFRHTFIVIQLFGNRGLYTTSDLVGGISDDTKTYYRIQLEKNGGQINITEEDYNSYEYLRHKHGKTKLFELIKKREVTF